MFFRQYYLGCLSHASYLIGDTTTGQAVVVDPQRDVAEYLADAAANGLTIIKVLETHFHADFLSGHLELAEHTGARIGYGNAAAGRAEFPIETFADGERIALGEVELEIRETPGHTPESISIVVYPHGSTSRRSACSPATRSSSATSAGPTCWPRWASTAEELARKLYHSLHDKLLSLPDATKVFPAHGAGSACGKNLSSETVSTIGEQRRTNYALAPMSEDEFVEAVTAGPIRRARSTSRSPRTATANCASCSPTTPRCRHSPSTRSSPASTTEPWCSTPATTWSSPPGTCAGRSTSVSAAALPSTPARSCAPDTPIVLVTESGHESEAKVRLARIGFDKVLGALSRPIDTFVVHPGARRAAVSPVGRSTRRTNRFRHRACRGRRAQRR